MLSLEFILSYSKSIQRLKTNKIMKDILIVFPDEHLPYSPSVLNLYERLNSYFKVTITTFKPDPLFSGQTISDKNVEYLDHDKWEPEKGVSLLSRLANEVRKSISHVEIKPDILLTSKAKILIDRIKHFDGIIIAVDFFALWCAQKATKCAHLFSLEILENDPYKKECRFDEILSLVIQSKERREFLFGQNCVKTFIVQNAPEYIEQKVNYRGRRNTDLVYCGSAVPGFGIFTCLEFLLDYPQYTITLQGALPPDVRASIFEYFGFLIESKRVILNETYLNPSELNDFLNQYYVGFVFYDAYRFKHLNTFNYKAAPSGKLFHYLNAGVPVVASNFSGLKVVEQYKAGITVNTLNSSSIKEAINTISENYEEFSSSAKAASLQFDFSRSISPYISYLKTL